MKSIVIIGNAEFSKLIYDYLKNDSGLNIVAFSVEKEFIVEKTIYDIPVIAYEEIDNMYKATEVSLIMGVGYKKMHDIRKRLFEIYTDKGYQFINYIHPSAIVPKDIIMGTGNVILERVVIERQSSIGNANLFFAGSILGHNGRIGNYITMSIHASTGGNVTIEDNCFIGINATVKDTINIGSYSLIGASTYVRTHTKPYTVIAAPYSVELEGVTSKEYM